MTAQAIIDFKTEDLHNIVFVQIEEVSVARTTKGCIRHSPQAYKISIVDCRCICGRTSQCLSRFLPLLRFMEELMLPLTPLSMHP